MAHKQPIEERFRRYTRKTRTCWWWTGRITAKGYGQMQYNGKPEHAHRVRWITRRGPIPAGMCVLHRCDNRACVRLSHLFIGTQLDNVRDRDSKGRQAKGERHHSAKLTATQVRRIRALQGKQHWKQVATLFAISQTSVHRIWRHQSWRHER